MLDVTRWNTDLMRRYDQPGPRYNSYPAASQFNDKVSSFDLLHALRSSRHANHPLSLYVHLPFCANACHYCSRTRVITKDRSCTLVYLERLEKEIELIACHLSPDQVVEQLHFGGGTPTFFSHMELRRLMAHLQKHFNLQDDDHGDFSIEIDPREADWSTMGLLRELGFNRISIGVQALNPEVQRAINRMQTPEQTQAIIEAARTLQYRSINIDLLCGLPMQTPERFAQTVKNVLELQPDRVSLYSYAHSPERFPGQRKINAADLPSEASKMAMLQHGVEELTAAGYRYIGMDHFALPDDELAIAQEDGTLTRNHQGYTTHGHCDLIGLGLSAISQIGDLYSQNHCDLQHYQQALDQRQLPTVRGLHLCEDDRIRRHVIQKLVCEFEVGYDEIEQAHGIRFREYFASVWPALEQMATDGILELGDKVLAVMPAGRLLVRSLCMLFDHYLQPEDSHLRLSQAF